jgi:pyridoxine 5-phosphate synthase
MIKLSVNLNKVALLRNQRDVGYPSVVGFARTVIDAGAHGITVHPRPDERHIRRSDVYDLATLIADEYRGQVEFNIEGNPTPEFMQLVREIDPDQATLVPDDPAQSTSDHGWDPDDSISEPLPGIIAELRELGIRTSLFMDSDPGLIERIHNVGADRIELYTGPWAESFGTPRQAAELASFVAAADKARVLGLGLNAGHDLNLDNLPAFCAAIPWLEELSIGHAITADALRMGFAEAVRAYLKAIL